jgi:predicted RecB family nuclease
MAFYQQLCEAELREKRVIGLLVGKARQPMEQGKHVARIDGAGKLSLDVLAQLTRVLSFRIHR